MAAPLTLASAKVTGALESERAAVTVRNNLLTIAERGGDTLVTKQPVTRVERLDSKHWRVTAADDAVYDLEVLKAPCGCGGGG